MSCVAGCFCGNHDINQMGRGITALPSQCTLDVFGKKNDRGVNEFVILAGKTSYLGRLCPSKRPRCVGVPRHLSFGLKCRCRRSRHTIMNRKVCVAADFVGNDGFSCSRYTLLWRISCVAAVFLLVMTVSLSAIHTFEPNTLCCCR